MKNEKGRLIQNPNYETPSLPLHVSEHTVLILRERERERERERGAFTSS